MRPIDYRQLCAFSGATAREGARERMSHVLADHKLHNLTPVLNWPQALGLPKPTVALAVLGIGCLWILKDPDRQAWHDKIAGTFVVKVPRNWPL